MSKHFKGSAVSGPKAAVLAAVPSLFVGLIAAYASYHWFGGAFYNLLPVGEGTNAATVLWGLAAIIALLTYSLLFQVLRNLYDLRLLAPIAICLLVLLAVALFGKNVGVRGLNLNPLDILHQLHDEPQTVLANFLCFAVLGTIGYCAVPSFAKMVFGLVGFSAFVEIAQYLFAVGICDVVDFLVNSLGGFAGAALGEALVKRGLTIVRMGRGRFSLHFIRSGEEKVEAILPRANIVVVLCLALFSTLLLFLVSPGTDPASPDATEDAIVVGETLQSLRRRSADPDEVSAGVDESGIEMTVNDDGRLSASGEVQGCVWWNAQGGDSVVGISIVLKEGLDRLGYTAVLPAVVSNDTDILMWGETSSVEDFQAALETGSRFSIEFVLSVQEGWLHADQISVMEDVTDSFDVSRPQTIFPWASYDALREDAGALPDPLLTSGGHSVMGYLDSVTSVGSGSAEEAYATVCVPGRLVSVPIVRAFSMSVISSGDIAAEGVGSPETLVAFTIRASGTEVQFVSN